jgi:hypothetical protein
VKLEGDFNATSKWRGYPNDAIDAAWKSITDGMFAYVHHAPIKEGTERKLTARLSGGDGGRREGDRESRQAARELSSLEPWPAVRLHGVYRGISPGALLGASHVELVKFVNGRVIVLQILAGPLAEVLLYRLL